MIAAIAATRPGGRLVNPSVWANGENGSAKAIATTTSVDTVSAVLARLRKKGTRRVRIAKMARLCVTSDSTNQPERKSVGLAPTSRFGADVYATERAPRRCQTAATATVRAATSCSRVSRPRQRVLRLRRQTPAASGDVTRSSAFSESKLRDARARSRRVASLYVAGREGVSA